MTLRCRRVISVLLGLAGLLGDGADSVAAGAWIPVRDISLAIEEGGILDFSGIAKTGPAGSQGRVIVNQLGRLAFDSNPDKPQRFLAAAITPNSISDSISNHGMADLYAKQLRMHGYNMVRLHFVDASLMAGRKNDFDFDADRVDQLHYLLAALKREGIYWMIDGLTSWNGAYGDVFPHRWVKRYNLKLGVYYDAEQQRHWRRLVEEILAKKNPYTGSATIDDPALAGIILVNEGGLAFLTREGIPDVLRPLFAEWLKTKYGNTKALAADWKGELGVGESLEKQTIRFPSSNRGSSKRLADTQQFFFDLERTTADWMTLHLRRIGYKGLVTAYDNWLSPAAHASRAQFTWVDMHGYFSEPTAYTMSGSRMSQGSLLEGGAKYIQQLAISKHAGKAFTVSEYGQPFWNHNRRESALAVAAYAGFQNWDMICQHTDSAIELSYASKLPRKQAIYPFGIALDPVARAGETLAALLFLRGDTAAAKHTLGVRLSPEYVFQENPPLSSIPPDISRLAFLTGVSIAWQGSTQAASQYDGSVEPTGSSLSYLGKAIDYATSKFGFGAEGRWVSRVEALKKAGLLQRDNITDPGKGVYQTDTGEIVLDSGAHRLALISSKTEAVVFDSGLPIALDKLRVEAADGPALISASAMDSKPLSNSDRILLILATDAMNTGMRFGDSDESTLLDLGHLPVLLRAARLTIFLAHEHPERLKLYSTTLTGKRADSIPIEPVPGGVRFILDTNTLRHGITTYFEITA
jgi:hypothetical protein